jgi:hypothetical protein
VTSTAHDARPVGMSMRDLEGRSTFGMLIPGDRADRAIHTTSRRV